MVFVSQIQWGYLGYKQALVHYTIRLRENSSHHNPTLTVTPTLTQMLACDTHWLPINEDGTGPFSHHMRIRRVRVRLGFEWAGVRVSGCENGLHPMKSAERISLLRSAGDVQFSSFYYISVTLPGSVRIFDHTPKQSWNISQMTTIALLVRREVRFSQVPLAEVNMITKRSHKTVITKRLQRNVVKQINRASWHYNAFIAKIKLVHYTQI